MKIGRADGHNNLNRNWANIAPFSFLLLSLLIYTELKVFWVLGLKEYAVLASLTNYTTNNRTSPTLSRFSRERQPRWQVMRSDTVTVWPPDLQLNNSFVPMRETKTCLFFFSHSSPEDYFYICDRNRNTGRVRWHRRPLPSTNTTTWKPGDTRWHKGNT